MPANTVLLAETWVSSYQVFVYLNISFLVSVNLVWGERGAGRVTRRVKCQGEADEEQLLAQQCSPVGGISRSTPMTIE